MLSSKQRLIILLLGAAVLIIPFGLNQLFVSTNSVLNPTIVNLYQQDTTIKYTYNDGTLGGAAKEISIKITPSADSTTTDVVATIGGVEKPSFTCDYATGKLMSGGSVTDHFTLFFILVNNPMVVGWKNFAINPNETIIDSLGLLGEANKEYLLVIGQKDVYWETAPELDGAQFSFQIHIYDPLNNKKVAEGLMDSTCGFLEVLHGGKEGEFIELTATSPGNFPISRNRYVVLYGGLIVSGIILVGCFLFMKWKKIDNKEIEEFMLLLGTACAVVIIDIDIDVWFYARFGEDVMLIMHLIVFACFALVCFRLKYGLKWALPVFIELAYLVAMVSLFTGDYYVPHITAFMGILMAHFAMLFRSGMEKREYDDFLDKII